MTAAAGRRTPPEGMVYNPNKKIVEAIERRLVINEGYCPCLPERTEDTKCFCLKARTEQKCCCNLLVPVGRQTE